MSEEAQVVAEQTEQQVAEVHTPTVEDTARAQGWKPKEEFDGDTSKWVSAETFVAKGELIAKIESLSKELKSQKKTTQMLQEHHAKVKESEFKRAVEYLKAQKKQAYERGDVDAIIDLDDQIANVRETQKMQSQQEEKSDKPDMSEFNSWVDQNSWYDTDKEMRESADDVGMAYRNRNPDKSPLEVLQYVEKQIKRMFPDKFTNPNRSKPSAVEGSSRSSGANSGKRDSVELTEDERKVMMTFVRQGVMTQDEYMKDIKSMRGA